MVCLRYISVEIPCIKEIPRIIIIIKIITILDQSGLDRPVSACVIALSKVFKLVFVHFVCNVQSNTKIPPTICT